MKMTARKAKTSSAVWAFNRPHHGFGSPLVRLDMGIGSFWINIRPIANIVRRGRNQNRGELHALRLGRFISCNVGYESHVEIPFVFDRERFHAIRNWVLRELQEVGFPHWIA